MSFVKQLIKSKKASQTLFTVAELSVPQSGYIGKKLNSAIKYAVKRSDLFRIARGLYSLAENFSRQEFANKFRSPSYISLYTVLSESGVVFQPYESIYSISKRSENALVGGFKYIYRKIKDEFLLNPLGVNNVNGVFRASAERAICDKLYLDGTEYFDNLRKIDWNTIKKINAVVYKINPVISKWISQNTK